MARNEAKAQQTVHGLTNHPLYRRWDAMKTICYNKNNLGYPSVGLKGIKVCEEWSKEFMVFYKWALENGWKDNASLRRHDKDKDFTPDNCFFAPGPKKTIMPREILRRSRYEYW